MANTRRSAKLKPTLPPNWLECTRGERIAWENRRVRSEWVCFGEVLYEPGGKCGPRVQRDWQLVFLHSGELCSAVDEREQWIAPGQVGLFRPGRTEHFVFSTTRETHHSWCSVAPSLVPPALTRLLEAAPALQLCDQVQARLLAAGVALDRADSTASQSVVDHIGLTLLTAYVAAGADREGEGVVARAVRYLEQHLAEETCLQQAHRAAGVSRNTLISRFGAELGVTPARYLWRLRAERGIAMLAETGHTVAEIAYACGFGDPSHFSRLVKHLQGVSPQNLRRALWASGTSAPPSTSERSGPGKSR